MPRFVVLYHQTPPTYERPTHWDLMLEMGTMLRTWALKESPTMGSQIDAEPLPNHRLEYLTYVGPVSNNRGDVKRVDEGEYSLIEESDSKLRVKLHGQHLNCELTLQSVTDQRWTASFDSIDESAV